MDKELNSFTKLATTELDFQIKRCEEEDDAQQRHDLVVEHTKLQCEMKRRYEQSLSEMKADHERMLSSTNDFIKSKKQKLQKVKENKQKVKEYYEKTINELTKGIEDLKMTISEKTIDKTPVEKYLKQS